ncbi:MAG: hypothetical protein CM15mP51_21080 [Porticoccaceae bacterium]|nr:MAG: hypothetical protein CM15mP51_21080 [Porticoccaceae bacterium]
MVTVFPDISDPFPLDASASNDTDMDGIADIYDPDDDGDGIIDEHDVLPKQKSVSEKNNHCPMDK